MTRLAAVFVVLSLLVACSAGDAGNDLVGAPDPTPVDPDTNASDSDAAPAASTAVPPARGAMTATRSSATSSPPPFYGTSKPLPDDVREWMRGSSWRRGCPVPLRDLRLLRMSFWGFDGEVHRGPMVVHADVAGDVLNAFRRIYRREFKIRRIRLVDAYGADDDRSMAANNTSAFNCRYVKGTTRWSQHSYGRAIDINPIQNPYVDGGFVDPPAGERYVNRRNVRKGMIIEGRAVTDAFDAIGWGWGGRWSSAKDYQHVSRSGH